MVRVNVLWLRLLRRCCGALLLSVAATVGSPVAAADHPAADAVLDNAPAMPWYDAAQGTLRKLEPPHNFDDPHRNSDWTSQAAAPRKKTTTNAESLGAKLLRFAVYGVLVIAITVLVILLVSAGLRSEMSARTAGTRITSMHLDKSRLQHLPMPLVSTDPDLLATARAYYDAGDFGHAVTYFFAHQLMELDRRQWIRLARGKTNRQYLHELGSGRAIEPVVRRTMHLFESTFFGKHPISRGQFEACWNERERFQHPEEPSA